MNTQDTLYQVILSALEAHPDVEVSDDLGPADVPGWDSFGWIQIMNAVEKHYAVELPLSALADIQTIGELRSLISQSQEYKVGE